MRGKRKRAIGLSIGTRSLALAEINIGAEGEIEVGGLGFVDLPDGAVVRGRIVDPATVSRTIRELFAASQVDGAKEVSLAIADEGSITGLQVLPSMSRNETLEALMGEVENYAALAGGEPALGFRVTNEAVEGTEQRMEVLFLAAPQELVDLYKATMESANLDMSAMETISLAAIRAFTYFTEQDEKASPTGNEPVMIVTIEKSGGMIIVILNGVIKFIHNIEMGSDKLQSERDFRELARELSTSANYYQNAFPTGGDIENIILSADEPNLADIGEKVGAFLDLSITIPQMPGTAEESKAEEQAGHNLSAYAAIGAAMRATTRDAAAINLLASSKKSGLMSLRKRVTLLLLIVFSVGLLSVGARYYIKSKADAVEQKLISLRAFQEMSETQAIADIVILQNGIAVLKTQTEISDAAVNSI